MAKHVLKKPLKIDAPHSFSFPAGTEIEITAQMASIGDMRCRQIIVDGRAYPAYPADLDEALDWKPAVSKGE
jgi:hypothetical protein